MNRTLRKRAPWHVRVYRLVPRGVLASLLVPLVLLTVGTVGYRAIEGPEWSWFDGLYMTGITLTTIGYGETHPLSTNGRVFTLFLAYGGIFTLFFTATELIRAVVSGEVNDALGERLMEERLREVHDHVIVCGFGRMGRMICQEFEAQRVHYVLVDRNAERLDEYESEYGATLHGDATSDETLKRAGIERARSLVTVLPSDADNLYIALGARLLNPAVKVVARAENEDAAVKLRKVGADRVVSPYVIGGLRVAHAVLRPTVIDYLDTVFRSEYLELQIEEVQVQRGSQLDGVSLRDSKIQAELGIIVVAMKRDNGEMLYNPLAATVIEADSVLIALGHRKQLDVLERWAGNRKR